MASRSDPQSDLDLLIPPGVLDKYSFPSDSPDNMVTTKMIESAYRDNLARAKDVRTKEDIENTLTAVKQRQLEGEIMKGISKDVSLEPFLVSLNLRELGRVIHQDFNDYEAMVLVSQIINSIPDKPDEYGNLTLSSPINEWLKNPRKIGVESSDGVAYQISFKSLTNLLVLKIPLRKLSDIRHELFVGMFGTNLLRKQIPNFAYIFGGFECSPVINLNAPNLCRAESGSKYTHILYENITPANTIRSMVHNLDAETYLSIFLQICFATLYANIHIDWTHHDLHPGNVLIRNISPPTKGLRYHYIEYPILDQVYYVKSKYIATIIDYGRSHIKYKGDDFGISSVKLGISPVGSFPIGDIYRFFMSSSAYILHSGKDETKSLVSSIYKYFNDTDSLYSSTKNQIDLYFQLPKNEVTSKLSILDLISYIIETQPELSSKVIANKNNIDKTVRVVSGGTGGTEGSKGSKVYRERLGLTPKSLVRIVTINDYYLTRNTQSRERVIDELEPIYPSMASRHLDETKALIPSLSEKIGEFRKDYSKYLSEEYISSLGKFIYADDNYRYLIFLIKYFTDIVITEKYLNRCYAAGMTSSQDFNDPERIQVYTKMRPIVNIYNSSVSSLSESIRSVFKVLNKNITALIQTVTNEINNDNSFSGTSSNRHFELSRLLSNMKDYRDNMSKMRFI